MSRVAPFLSFFLFATALLGQEFRATVTGLVTDPTSAAVPNAVVQARNRGTNEVAASSTDSRGSYTIPLLKPGTYDVSVEAGGFKKVTRENLTLNVGQTVSMDFTLEVGAVTETLSVTAEVALLETSKADRGLVID